MALSLPPELGALAELQAGALSRRQLRQAGLSSSAIQRRIASGAWRRVYPGVVVCHNGPLSREAEMWSAVLYAGEGAALSHQAAAEAWRLLDGRVDPIHVSIDATRQVGSRPGLIVHRRRGLPALIHPSRRPPMIGLEETVLDLVDVSRTALDAMGWVTRACRQRKTTTGRLAAALNGRSRIRWRTELSQLLTDVAAGAESPLELVYLRDVERSHGLPTGKRQRHRRIRGRTQWCDVDYAEFGVLVELDGRLGHELEPFRDHERDNASTLLGRATLRYGWESVLAIPCAVAAEVANALQQRGWTGRPRICGYGCGLAQAA